MTIAQLTAQIEALVEDFGLHRLPKFPNIAGVFQNSTITLDHTSGADNPQGTLDIEYTLIVATTLRTVDATQPELQDLDTLLELLFYLLKDAKFPQSKKVQGLRYLKTFPSSGKWRATLTFTVPLYYLDTFEEQADGLLSVDLNYQC